MRLLAIAIVSVFITSSANAAEFSFDTTYWFNKIVAKCADYVCEVHVNGEFKGKYKYQIKGSIAFTTIKGIKVSYNLITKELKY